MEIKFNDRVRIKSGFYGGIEGKAIYKCKNDDGYVIEFTYDYGSTLTMERVTINKSNLEVVNAS